MMNVLAMVLLFAAWAAVDPTDMGACALWVLAAGVVYALGQAWSYRRRAWRGRIRIERRRSV